MFVDTIMSTSEVKVYPKRQVVSANFIQKGIESVIVLESSADFQHMIYSSMAPPYLCIFGSKRLFSIYKLFWDKYTEWRKNGFENWYSPSPKF